MVYGGPDHQVTGTPGEVFRAWEITSPGPAFRGSYGLNQSLFTLESGDDSWSANPRLLLETNTFSLRGTARIPMLLDSTVPMARAGDEKQPPPRDGFRAASGMGTFCTKRHDEYVNGLFLDWSARKIGLKELWTLKWHPSWNTAGPWTKAGGVKPEQWPRWMRNMKDY
jgi:prepilin-type processing-associated H-X9-DG protein